MDLNQITLVADQTYLATINRMELHLPVVYPDLLITSQGRNAPDSLMLNWNTAPVFSYYATARNVSEFAFIFVVSF